MTNHIVEKIFDDFCELSSTDITKVPEPERTVIAIYTAHGIIGNGGFRYFFENDFCGMKDYSTIIQSYKNVGLDIHADFIEKLIAIFPNGFPQKDLGERSSFLEQYFEVENPDYLSSVEEAEDHFFESYKSAFELAISYYEKNV